MRIEGRAAIGEGFDFRQRRNGHVPGKGGKQGAARTAGTASDVALDNAKPRDYFAM